MRRIAEPGQGKWRLKGRGRRYRCWSHHKLDRQCRFCGAYTYAVASWQDVDLGPVTVVKSAPHHWDDIVVEIGRVEKVRFIEG